MTLREFLRTQTRALELCVIRDGGWIVATAWIDLEDLFRIDEKIGKKEVISHNWGLLMTVDRKGDTKYVECHFIDI